MFLPFFPQSISGLVLVFSFGRELLTNVGGVRIEVRNRRKPDERGWVALGVQAHGGPGSESDVTIKLIERATSAPEIVSKDSGTPVGAFFAPETKYAMIPIAAPPLMVLEPGVFDVYLENGGCQSLIGTFQCGFAAPPPLTLEEKRSFLERPAALCALRFEISCKACKEKFYLSTFLDPSQGDKPAQPGVTLERAPDRWTCSCGKTTVPLMYAKLGLHELFRHQGITGSPAPIGFTPTYQRMAVDGVLAQWQTLINSMPKEEQVQAYLERNQVLWSFLSPIQVIPKPKLLTKLVGDFALLGPNRSLYLVELEKPQTKLVRADGGLHWELQRGLDQLNSWRRLVETDFRTLMSQLGFKEDEVHRVEYVLIAGLAHKTDAEHLPVLRKSFHGVHFYTFDELTSRLQTIQASMAKL